MKRAPTPGGASQELPLTLPPSPPACADVSAEARAKAEAPAGRCEGDGVAKLDEGESPLDTEHGHQAKGARHAPDPSPRPSPLRGERVAEPGEGDKIMCAGQAKKEQEASREPDPSPRPSPQPETAAEVHRVGERVAQPGEVGKIMCDGQAKKEQETSREPGAGGPPVLPSGPADARISSLGGSDRPSLGHAGAEFGQPAEGPAALSRAQPRSQLLPPSGEAHGAKPRIGVSKGRQGFSLAERRLILFFAYGMAIVVAHWLAFQLRFDFKVPMASQHAIQMQTGWWLTLPLKMLALLVFGQFTGLLGYFSMPDLWRIIYAMSSVSLVLLLTNQMGIAYLALPRGVILTDYVLSTAAIVAIRTGFRVARERMRGVNGARSLGAKRVGIIGAGDVGASLAKDLLSRRGLGLVPVAFFDDDPQKWHSQVHGVPVVGRPEALRDPNFRLDLDEVIIAMPMAKASRIGEIVRLLQAVHLKFETVPSLEQLATGKVRVSQLRPVEIQDLLQREPVELDAENIRQQIQNRTVLVTGAGGSIGSELCRQIVDRNPRSLLLLDQSEVQLFPIEQELLGLGYGGQIVPIIADILDGSRLRHVFARFKPELVFHAAAHKHVPMMESQPSEALKNNSFGTARLAQVAQEHRAARFVLISTDKAINPTSVMGASKRLAEIFLQALAASQPNGTKFMAVRFGNVLGSSGSVIPVFTRQIAAGGPVTVTHPEVTRYFMTIPEAVGLVLQSAFMGVGGEIFVLDMGQPVKIADLARQLIELSGLEPDEDIEIRFTGLRPGEKLFEELSHKNENHQPTSHAKVMRFVSQPRPLEAVQAEFAALERMLDKTERNQLKQKIKELVPEYQPYLV